MKNKIFMILNILISITILFSCNDNKKKTNSELNVINDSSNNKHGKENIDTSKGIFSLMDFFVDSKSLNVKVDKIFNALNDNERISQMIITSAGELGKPKDHVTELIRHKIIGGVVLLKGSKQSFSELIYDFNNVNNELKGIPLLYSCDAEPSLLNAKIIGSPIVIKTNEIKTVKQCDNVAKTIAEFIKQIGFHQNYAPVCDFDYNQEIIGNRSFGRDSTQVSILSDEFIKLTQESGIVATAKHFPGHGNVKGDSHSSLVFIDGEMKELGVFQSAIKSGVISIMVGHIAVKNNKEYDTEGKPSTISRKIVTNLLKEKLGFKGIVITDAMNMGGVVTFSTPGLNAIKAGCDIILMPTDEEKLHQSIIAQIASDDNFKKQIYDSVKKIIKLKICLGLIN